MITYTEVYNSLQSTSLYEKITNGMKIIITIPPRDGFLGEITKPGSILFRCFSHTDLLRVINNINIFISEKMYESYHVRFETVQSNNTGTPSIPCQTGFITGIATKVNASPKPQDMGNTQTKVALDWGENVQRQVNVCDQHSDRPCTAGETSDILISRNA
jgi:hypothetical protein